MDDEVRVVVARTTAADGGGACEWGGRGADRGAEQT